MTDPAARGDAKVRPPDVVPLDRFNAFSDGVFAIAITLLVLELTVPVGPERLLPALVEQWPEFLGYLISFAFIGGSWNTHARMTRLMKRGDGLVSEINLLFLLFVAVLPFSTSLMVTHLSGPDVTVAVLIYGLNVLAASLMLTFLMAHLVRERALLTGDVADDTLVVMTRQRRSLNAIWIIGVLCALVVPPVAIGLYMVATAMLLVLPIIHLRRARGSTSSPGATVD